MSNEISLFRDTTSSTIPAHLRNQEVDETTKALMGGGLSSKRISIRGSVWRMMVNGKEVAKNEDRKMDFVIVAAAPKISRTYYAGTYNEGDTALPDCWSNDGEKPEERCENPQAKFCRDCPQNIAGSGQGASRACRFSQRLAVVPADDVENNDVYQLILPAQSIFGEGENGKMPLQQYAKLIAGHGLSVTQVVTEARFDTDSSTPKLTFRAARYLDAAEYAIAVEKGKSPEAIAAITYNPAQTDGAKAKPKNEKPIPETGGSEEPKVRKPGRPPKGEPKASDLASVIAEWGDED